jgi:[ribosomal protein S5]-alanine N-acetyltransferase
MIIVENEVCKLRNLELNDLEALSNYANNQKIAINLRNGFPYPYTLEDAKSFYHHVKNQDSENSFVIEYNGSFAGMIGLMQLKDVYCKSAEIGYWLGEPFWNKGIMTKAVTLMVEWGWKNLDIVRIHTGIFSYNKASAKVLEKSGFSFECEFITSIFKNEKLVNELRYYILKP